MGVSKLNAERYPDPTAYEALTNIARAERAEKHPYRPLVYICSPFSADPEGGAEKARKYSRFAVDAGAIPFAPHLLLPQYMDESTERDLAMFMDKVFLDRCEQLWVFGSTVSKGMDAEIRRARRKSMTIRYFTEELEETNGI